MPKNTILDTHLDIPALSFKAERLLHTEPKRARAVKNLVEIDNDFDCPFIQFFIFQNVLLAFTAKYFYKTFDVVKVLDNLFWLSVAI